MKVLTREGLRATLMAYIHGEFPNYEPVLCDLLTFEQALFEENQRKNGGTFERGRRAEKTWQLVFEELAGMLTPLQTEQLVDRLTQDFRCSCPTRAPWTEARHLQGRVPNPPLRTLNPCLGKSRVRAIG